MSTHRLQKEQGELTSLHPNSQRAASQKGKNQRRHVHLGWPRQLVAQFASCVQISSAGDTAAAAPLEKTLSPPATSRTSLWSLHELPFVLVANFSLLVFNCCPAFASGVPSQPSPHIATGGILAAMAVGVLALQGSFKEHIACLRKLGVDAVEIRKPEQLAGLSGLIIPGGESTTMAKLAEKNMLFPALREFSSSGKPIWGTCAGLIFLADRASGVKKGGQELLGGLDCTVHRNFFGSQLNSFEMELPVPVLASHEGGSETCRAVFIRAPAIVDVGPSVQVLAEYPLAPGQTFDVSEQEGGGMEKVVVAVKQKNMLATAFHPELTSDLRWHSFFMKMISSGKEGAQIPGTEGVVAKKADLPQGLNQVRDMPVFKEASFLSLEFQ